MLYENQCLKQLLLRLNKINNNLPIYYMHKCTEVTLSENSKNKCAQKEVDNKVVVAVIDLHRQWYWGWRKCVCCCSVSKSCLTLCEPTDCGTPGFSVHHHLPKFAQTRGHWLVDAIQPSLPLSVSPSALKSFPASGSFPMSQLFTSCGQSIGVSASSSVLPMNIQDWSLGWTSWISLQSRGLSRVLSNTTVQRHPFFGALAFFRKERWLQN